MDPSEFRIAQFLTDETKHIRFRYWRLEHFGTTYILIPNEAMEDMDCSLLMKKLLLLHMIANWK